MDQSDLVRMLRTPEAQEILWNLAVTDPDSYLALTGGHVDGQTRILSKTAIEDRLLLMHVDLVERSTDQADPYNFCYGLLDIDNFGEVNTKFKWQTGDEVIAYVVRHIRDNLRIPGKGMPEQDRGHEQRKHSSLLSDTLGYAGRVGGGEEFGIILPNCGPREAHAVIDRILYSIRDGVPSSKHTGLQVTVSGGIAPYAAGMGVERLIAHTGNALGVAKRTGKDRALINVPDGILIGGNTQIYGQG
ncbi:MAG: GGDEF domain-containing protein [Nanoarchaeota archaeon]